MVSAKAPGRTSVSVPASELKMPGQSKARIPAPAVTAEPAAAASVAIPPAAIALPSAQAVVLPEPMVSAKAPGRASVTVPAPKIRMPGKVSANIPAPMLSVGSQSFADHQIQGRQFSGSSIHEAGPAGMNNDASLKIQEQTARDISMIREYARRLDDKIREIMPA
jgi:hypothetical protein